MVAIGPVAGVSSRPSIVMTAPTTPPPRPPQVPTAQLPDVVSASGPIPVPNAPKSPAFVHPLDYAPPSTKGSLVDTYA